MTTDASDPTPETAADFAPNGDAFLATQVEALQAQLAEAQAAAATAKDAQLRAAAEAENRVRRAEREADNSVKFGSEKLLKDLLPVADSLELGIKAAGSGDTAEGVAKALLDGSAMTLRQLLATLERHGVKPVDPAGQSFNAELHQAMAMAPSADVPANHVVNVLQKGYTLNERLLRPALVVVAQAG